MARIVAIHEYQAVTFNIYREQTDPEEGPVEIYYYWERDDLPRDAVGHSSFLPVGSVEEAIEDAEIDLDGWAVRCWLTAEEGRALH
jgi:hypothetical protein